MASQLDPDRRKRPSLQEARRSWVDAVDRVATLEIAHLADPVLVA
jgi:hypothetical protein